jgi:2-polyprenyl-3-methyl-5-hydroxy-6-metoxy-1,4-benzoquinol methylase
MATAEELVAFRLDAAEKSGGTSSPHIKDFILRLISPMEGVEKVLDFGAGKGELLTILSEKFPEWLLTGTDIMERPVGLGGKINWHQQDLNNSWRPGELFDLVICSEVIEHLENPRQLFRDLFALIRPGGRLVLTMPNQESYRSLLSLWWRGNHVSFVGDCYPAHITALVAQDLQRMASEVGLRYLRMEYSGIGCIPKLTRFSWQGLSLGLLRGRRFSDGMAIVARKELVQ